LDYSNKEGENALTLTLYELLTTTVNLNTGEVHIMTDETFDPAEGEDYFDDGDLANPEPLPVGKRFIGIASVDTTATEIGKYRKVEGKLKAALVAKGDHRDELPEVVVNLTAIGVAGQPAGFPEDKNYQKQGKINFWVGKVDKMGRNALARLIRDASGKTEEEIKSMPIRESAKFLDKVYLTFEVKHTVGDNRTYANPISVKAATSEEVSQVM
jgi:hypothetical protein